MGCRVNHIEQVAIAQFRPLFCSDVHAQNDILALTSIFSDDDKRGFCNAMFQLFMGLVLNELNIQY